MPLHDICHYMTHGITWHMVLRDICPYMTHVIAYDAASDATQGTVLNTEPNTALKAAYDDAHITTFDDVLDATSDTALDTAPGIAYFI